MSSFPTLLLIKPIKLSSSSSLSPLVVLPRYLLFETRGVHGPVLT